MRFWRSVSRNGGSEREELGLFNGELVPGSPLTVTLSPGRGDPSFKELAAFV